MLPWLLVAALVILPIILRYFADDAPRNLERGDQDDGEDEPERDPDLPVAA